MVKIGKLLNWSVAVLILSYSSIALSKTNLEALRDSFLCKGVNSLDEQVKLLKPFILKQKKNLITLKQPIVFGNVQSNLVNAVEVDNKIDQLHLVFKVDYREVQKNLPVKLHRGRTMEEDQGDPFARRGRNLLVLQTGYNSPEYPTALVCQYER